MPGWYVPCEANGGGTIEVALVTELSSGCP